MLDCESAATENAKLDWLPLHKPRSHYSTLTHDIAFEGPPQWAALQHSHFLAEAIRMSVAHRERVREFDLEPPPTPFQELQRAGRRHSLQGQELGHNL